MNHSVINIQQKFHQFSELWSPKIIAQMNDYQFKLVNIQGDFVWHRHNDTDEVFIVLEGELRIDFRDGSSLLQEGEMLVIPKGVEHKPFAETLCKMMLVEPAGVTNTGDSGGELTADTDVWV